MRGDVYMGCRFKALSDERRRTILAILGENDASAGEIARRFSISQPTVSNHLKILKEAGLITEQKIRQNRIYSLYKPGIHSVIETLKNIVKEA